MTMKLDIDRFMPVYSDILSELKILVEKDNVDINQLNFASFYFPRIIKGAEAGLIDGSLLSNNASIPIELTDREFAKKANVSLEEVRNYPLSKVIFNYFYNHPTASFMLISQQIVLTSEFKAVRKKVQISDKLSL